MNIEENLKKTEKDQKPEKENQISTKIQLQITTEKVTKSEKKLLIETDGNKLLKRIALEEGEKIEDPVICYNCKGILIIPRNCVSCENFYCKGCIEKISKKNDGNCKCGKKYENKEPHKLIKKILSRLNFFCINKKKGCEVKIKYQNVNNHKCDFEIINCENEFCNTQINRKDYEMHKQNCDFKKIICKFCQNGFFLCNLLSHESTCEKKPLLCSGCEKEIFQKNFKEHYQNCEFIKETCESCLTVIRRNEKIKHTKEKCLHKFYLKTRERVNFQLNSLKKLIAHLNKRLNEQEVFFGSKCDTCNKYVCEVSKRICEICRNNYCYPCSRKRIRNCRFCEAFCCSKCFSVKSDTCQICYKNRKNDNFGDKVFRRKGRRGRPRKINNHIDSFIID